MTEKQKAANEENKQHLTPFTSETGRAAQPKSVEKRNARKEVSDFVANLVFKEKKPLFTKLVEEALKGNVAAMEQLRKWAYAEGNDKQMQNVINLVVQNNEEKNALDKWSGE